MKAVVVEHRGEAGSLKEIPTPQPAEGEILVRVTAAGVNPIDWKLRDRGDEPLPFVLGRDFAGVVSALGSRVSKYREGERVFGCADHGAYAEYTIVPENGQGQPISKIADAVGDADAAAQERIRVIIAEERPLAEAAEALAESKRGSVNGKIIITVD